MFKKIMYQYNFSKVEGLIMYGLGGYYYFDWTYIFVIIGIVISAIASSRVNSTFKRYSRTISSSGLTGAETARRILDANGLHYIKIVPVGGSLTDHYNPRDKTISLSEPVMNSNSISAVSVAAHECGHAIQDLQAYQPYLMRSAIVPGVNIASRLSIPIIMIGFFIASLRPLIPIGIILFSSTLLFQLVTLPVEFDASNRAFDLLEDQRILSRQEVQSSQKVLNAAALTYVAAALSTVLTILRFVILYNDTRRRD